MYIVPVKAVPMDMTHLVKGEWRNFMFPECRAKNADLLVLSTQADYPAIKLVLTPPVMPQIPMSYEEMEADQWGDRMADHHHSLWAEWNS